MELPTLALTRSGDKGYSQPSGTPVHNVHYTTAVVYWNHEYY